MNIVYLSGGGGHVDPSTWTRGEILAVCGALFTARYPLPWGPRPNAPSNSLNIGEVFNYANRSDRTAAFKAYTDRGYTHAAMGPWVPSSDGGYHGMYPYRALTFDQYLDEIQELADHGIKAANFLGPDNWSIDDIRTWLLPMYAKPRARQLIRLVGPMGWEPNTGTPNAMFVTVFNMVRATMPDAQLFLHLNADFDAPGNNDDLTPGLPTYIGNAGCWQRLAQAGLDAYFAQVGGYWRDQNPVPQPGFLASYANHCQDQHRRFYNGSAGWPTHNDHGEQIRFIMAEYASYPDFNFDWPESYARQLGDVAMANAADGYLDGGYLPARNYGD